MIKNIHTYDKIYKLFYDSLLVETTKTKPLDNYKTPPSTPIKEHSMMPNTPNTPITPISKAILESLTPISQDKMKKILQSDDKIQKQKDMYEEQIDLDYFENLEANQLGF